MERESCEVRKTTREVRNRCEGCQRACAPSFAAAVRPCGRSVCVHAVRGVFVFWVVFRYFGLFLVVRARIPAVSVPGSRYRPRIRPRRAGKRLRALLGPSRRVRGVRVRVGCHLRRICMWLVNFGLHSRRSGVQSPPRDHGSSSNLHASFAPCARNPRAKIRVIGRNQL